MKMTPGEKLMKMCLDTSTIPEVREYVQEHLFHPTRKWRLDFAWAKFKIGLEVEGGVWIQGRHNRPTGFLKDVDKYNEAVFHGWRIVRFSTQQVKNGTAIAFIEKLFASILRGAM